MGSSTGDDGIQCLTEDVIQQFLNGELSDDQDLLVSDHLEDCSACQRLTMSFLSVDDLCLPWVRASARETVDLAWRSADTVMVNRLKQMARDGASPDQDVFSGSSVRASDVRRQRVAREDAVPETIGKYEIVAVIGQGAMGTVYLGIDHDLGYECAIKVLRKSWTSSLRAVERARREMQAVRRLTHPGIVSVLNAGTLDDGRSFLVMEFLRGNDLQSYVDRHGPLPADQACRIVRDAALGLQHAHEHGLIHRDVKPSNLFWTDDGDVRVLDFGLVRLKNASACGSDVLTETGFLLGTVDFMSPEQATDSRCVDARSDIYSLGCTLAWLVSGKNVFPGRTMTEVLFAHRDIPAVRLEVLRPDVPEGLNAVFQKMVAKKPQDRFQSMSEVADALQPFVTAPVTGTAPGAVRRESGVDRAGPAMRRRFRTSAVWCGMLFCLCAVIILLVERFGETSRAGVRSREHDQVAAAVRPPAPSGSVPSSGASGRDSGSLTGTGSSAGSE